MSTPTEGNTVRLRTGPEGDVREARAPAASPREPTPARQIECDQPAPVRDGDDVWRAGRGNACVEQPD